MLFRSGDISRTTGAITSTGTVTLEGAGAQAVDFSGSTLAALAVANTGTVTNAGSFSVSSFTKTLAGTFTLALADTMSVSGSFIASAGTVTLTGPYAGGAALFTVNGGTVAVGTSAFAAGAMSVSSGSFTQTGANGGAQTAASIAVSGTGSCVWDSGIAGGTLTVTGGTTLTAGTLNFNLKNVTIGTAVTGAVSFYDLLIPVGTTLTPGPSTTITVLRHLTIDNGGAYSAANNPTLVLGTAAGAAGNITDSNGTPTNLGAVAVDTQARTMQTAIATASLDIRNGGSLSTNAFALTVSGSVATSAGAGALAATGAEAITVGRDFTVTSFTQASSTVILSNGTAGAASLGGGYTFNNLTINKAAAGDTVTLGGPMTVAASLTMTQGTLSAGANPITLTSGNWDSSAVNFAFTQGTSTVRLDAASPTISQKAADSFYNLTLQAGEIGRAHV